MAVKPSPRGTGKNSGARSGKPPKPSAAGNGAGTTKPTPAGGKSPAKKASNWVGKDMNLTAAQRKAAVRVVGTKGGKTRTESVKAKERAASRKAVDISTTKWNTVKDRGGKGRGGLLTGADGKPVTGTVKLANGKTASYVRGKRISVMAEKPAPRSAPRLKGGGSGSTTTRTTTKRTAPRPDKPKSKPQGAHKPPTGGYTAKPKRTGGAVPQSVYNSQVPNNGYQSYAEAANGIKGNPNDNKWGVNPDKIGTGTRTAPKPAKKATTSPNKRGGEKRTPEQIARDKTRAYIRSQKPWGTGA